MTFSAKPRDISGPLAAMSLLAGLVLFLSSRLGIGRTPMRSVEVLVVPILTLLFLYPAYALAKMLPVAPYNRLAQIASDRRFQAVCGAVVIIGMLSAIWLIFGRIVESQWGPIDDHEIFYFLGSDGRARIAEIPALLSQTEAGRYGGYARFRPTYYLLRIAESVAWGSNPTLWYACRLVLLGLGATVFWLLMSPALGKLVSAFLCLYALSFGYWVEIVGRLGPSETYTVVGLPVFICGVIHATQNEAHHPGKRVLACAAVLFGSVVCMGSKENYLLLVLPLAYLLFAAIRRRDYLLLASTAASLLFGSYVGSSILLALSHTGADIYGKSISLGGKLNEILSVTEQRHYITAFTVLVGLTIAVGALRWIPKLTVEQRSAIRAAQLWLPVLCGVYLSQMVFYNASWPITIERYLFPGLLYLPASVVILYGLGEALLRDPASNWMPRFALRASVLVSLTLAIAYHGGYSDTMKAVRGKVAETRAFTAQVERVVSQLKQDESKQLVIESGDRFDYEPALAYPRFLNGYQVRNPLYVRVRGYNLDPTWPADEMWMATDLQRHSIEGGDGYHPLASLDERPTRCFSLYLSVKYPTSCTPIE